jgi:hypothetical protein
MTTGIDSATSLGAPLAGGNLNTNLKTVTLVIEEKPYAAQDFD